MRKYELDGGFTAGFQCFLISTEIYESRLIFLSKKIDIPQEILERAVFMPDEDKQKFLSYWHDQFTEVEVCDTQSK